MSAADFWSNRERAQADVEGVSRLRSLINPLRELEREVEDFAALQQLAAEETDAAARTRAEHDFSSAGRFGRLPAAHLGRGARGSGVLVAAGRGPGRGPAADPFGRRIRRLTIARTSSRSLRVPHIIEAQRRR